MEREEIISKAQIQTGYQTRTRIKEDPNGTYSIIQGKDFDSLKQLRLTSLASFIPKRQAEPYSVSRGDVLFMSRGTEHYAYCIKEELENTLVSSSFYIIRVSGDGLLPEYLAWWLNQPPARAFFRAQSSGTIMAFVSKSTLAETKVDIPSIDVQDKITRINALWLRAQLLEERLHEARDRMIRSISLKSVREKE